MWLASHLFLFIAATVGGYVAADGVLPERVAAVWYDEAAAILFHNARFVVVLFVSSLLTYGVAGCVILAINGLAFGVMLGMAPTEKVWWVVLYVPIEVLSYACISTAAIRFSAVGMRWLRTGSIVVRGRHVEWLAVGLYGVAVAAWLEAWAIVGAWA